MEKKRKIIVVSITILLVVAAAAFFFFGPDNNSSNETGQQLRYVPLNQAQIEAAGSAIMSSDFIQDVPEKYPVALTFYSFDGDEQVVQDTFLLGKGQLLQEGTPEIYIGIHSKYIEEVEEKGLCDTINEAVNNGEVTFYSGSNKASLFIKYSGMLKYRECFGF